MAGPLLFSSIRFLRAPILPRNRLGDRSGLPALTSLRQASFVRQLFLVLRDPRRPRDHPAPRGTVRLTRSTSIIVKEVPARAPWAALTFPRERALTTRSLYGRAKSQISLLR